MTTLTINERSILEERFYSVEPMMIKLVRQHQSRYGGDWEDLWGRAQELFMRAYKAHNPDSGASFSTWVYKHVWGGLFDDMRVRARRHAKLPRVDWETASLHLVDESVGEFNFESFTEEMSKDAKQVVLLTLTNTKGKRKDKRSLVRLLEDLGWEPDRIKETFTEITEAIHD